MHVIDIRAALDEAYQKAGKPLPTYSDATIVVGQTVVKVSHLNDVRGVFRALFTPTISGPLNAGSRTVSGTGIPGSSVQLFVNRVARGAPVIVNALGQWTLSNLTPALAENDVVTAQETLSGLSSDASGGVVVGPILTQIAFVHADGNTCPPLANCALNLRLLDPLKPAHQTPITTFPTGTLTEPPVWSKDFFRLAFASSLNGANSLEPLLSVFAIDPAGTNLAQLTGNGVLVPFPGPIGTVTGHIVPAPAHSPVVLPRGTFPACPNPLQGLSAPCQLADGTYYVPGRLVACQITAQGLFATAPSPPPYPCSNLSDGSFVVPNVPVRSSWVRALATVVYNDPAGWIPSTPQIAFFGYKSIIVQAGQVTDVTIVVENKFHASRQPSWSRDGGELIVTGTGYITSPQIQGNVVAWTQDVTTDLELEPASVGGPVVGCSPIDITVGGCIGSLQVINATDGTVVGTVAPPSLLAELAGSDWSRVDDRLAAALNGAVLGLFGAVPVRGIVVMNPMSPRGSTAQLLVLPNPVQSTMVQLVNQVRWSPNGLQVAFTQTTVNATGPTAVDDLFVVNTGGGHLTQLTQIQIGQTIEGISWSPDGRMIAFDVVTTSGFPNQTPTSADIFAINGDGTGRVRLTTDGRSFGPAWRMIP